MKKVNTMAYAGFYFTLKIKNDRHGRKATLVNNKC